MQHGPKTCAGVSNAVFLGIPPSDLEKNPPIGPIVLAYWGQLGADVGTIPNPPTGMNNKNRYGARNTWFWESSQTQDLVRAAPVVSKSERTLSPWTIEAYYTSLRTAVVLAEDGRMQPAAGLTRQDRTQEGGPTDCRCSVAIA